MYLGPLIVGVAVGFMIMAPSDAADYCAKQPDGKYCLDDLTGYHACVNSTDKPQTCPKNTRCTCMGLPCSTGSNPCGSYSPTPTFPASYKLAGFNEQIYHPTKPKQYSYYAFARDVTNLRYREDITIGPVHDPPYEYFIVLGHDKTFDAYEIVPSKQTCAKTTVPALPSPSHMMVPTKYTSDGNAIIDGLDCQKWLWQEGGHTKADPINTETYYTRQSPQGYFYPVAYRGDIKTDNLTITRDYTFTTGTPDDVYFDLPDFCAK